MKFIAFSKSSSKNNKALQEVYQKLPDLKVNTKWTKWLIQNRVKTIIKQLLTIQ